MNAAKYADIRKAMRRRRARSRRSRRFWCSPTLVAFCCHHWPNMASPSVRIGWIVSAALNAASNAEDSQSSESEPKLTGAVNFRKMRSVRLPLGRCSLAKRDVDGVSVDFKKGDIVYPVFPDCEPWAFFEYLGFALWMDEHQFRYIKPRSWWRRLIGFPAKRGESFFDRPENYKLASSGRRGSNGKA